jgi:RimJ/RimL family protein N-acetyltransferase
MSDKPTANTSTLKGILQKAFQHFKKAPPAPVSAIYQELINRSLKAEVHFSQNPLTSSISVRPMKEDEWKDYRDAMLLFLEEDKAPGDDIGAVRRWTEKDVRKIIRKSDDGIFGLYDEGKFIGTSSLILQNKGTEAFHGNTWIEKEYRGRGLSGKLLTATLDWAKSHTSVRRIVVSHRDGNKATQAIQSKFGFVHTHDKQPSFWREREHAEKYYALQIRP